MSYLLTNSLFKPFTVFGKNLEKIDGRALQAANPIAIIDSNHTTSRKVEEVVTDAPTSP
jgi:hypothetical protein